MSSKLPVTCIYWQQGRCFKDERSCRFIHGTICRYDPCKREDCDRVHLKHGRDRDRGYGSRNDSRHRRSPNRYQEDRRYTRSPRRYRSKSPRGRKSPQRYGSPNNRNGSRSPNPKRYGSKSPNPKRYDSRSPDPKRYTSKSRSPNPLRYSRSNSPTAKKQGSRSPYEKRYGSRSPNQARYSRSKSPNQKRYSRSPNSKRYSKSPNPKRYGSQSPNPKRYGSRSPNPVKYNRGGSRSPNPVRYGRSQSPRNRQSLSPLNNRSLSPNQQQRHGSGRKSSTSPRRERSPTPKKKKRKSPKLLASPSPERHGSDSTVHEYSPPLEKNTQSKWKKVERSPSKTREKSFSPENKQRSRSNSPMSLQTRNIQSDEEYGKRTSSKDDRQFKKRDESPNENRQRSPVYTMESKEDNTEELEEPTNKKSPWPTKPSDFSSGLRNLVASLSNSKIAELSAALESRDKLSSGNKKRHEKVVTAVEGLEEVGEEVEEIFDSEEHEPKEKHPRNHDVEEAGVNPSPPHQSHTSAKRDLDISYKSDWDLKSAIENPSQPMEKAKPPQVNKDKGSKGGELWTPALDRRREAKAQMQYETRVATNTWEMETPYHNRDSKRKSAAEDTQSSEVSDKSMAPPKSLETLSSAGKLLSSLMSHGGKVTDIPSSLTQVMPSPMVDSRASSKSHKSAQAIIDELLESRSKDSPKNVQSPGNVDKPVKSGKDIKEMGYEVLEKSLNKSSDLVKELLRSKSRSASPDERISRKSSYDSSSGKTKKKQAKEKKKRKQSTSSSDSSSSDEEVKNIEKENLRKEDEKKKGKYKEEMSESQNYDDLKRQRESLLRKIKLFRNQKSQLNEQKEDVIKNHRGDDESLDHLLEENSALQKEMGKQILNMSQMLRDTEEQMDDFKENRISDKSESQRRNEEDYYQNDAEEKYRRDRKQGNEKYRRENEDMYPKESEDRYRRGAAENYRRGEDNYRRESEERYRREPSPRRESRRDMSPQRRDRRQKSPYYRDEHQSNERNVYMETEVPHNKRSHSPYKKRSGSPRSPVTTSRHQRSPDGRRSQSPPVKRQQIDKERGMDRQAKSRIVASAALEQSGSEEDAEEYGPVPSQKQYIRYTDAGMHWCKLCTHFSDTIPEYADHLLSSDHLAKAKADRKTWLAKAPKVEKDVKPPNVEYVTLPVQGVEFIHSMTSFYCSLCDYFMRDKQELFTHPESKKHINNYKIHQSKNPMYETTYTKAKGTFYAKFKLEEQRKFFEEKRKAKDEARAQLKEKENIFERSRRQGSIERYREDTEDYDNKVEKDEFKSYSSIRVASRGSGVKPEAETRRSAERIEDEPYWSRSSSKQKSSSRSGSTADAGKAIVTKPIIEPKKIDVKIDTETIVEKDRENQRSRESKSGQHSSAKTPFIGKMPFLRRKGASKDDDDSGSKKSSGRRNDDKDRSKDDKSQTAKKSVEKAFTENLEKNLNEFLKTKMEQKKKESENSPAAISDDSDEEIEVLDPRTLIPPSAKPAVQNVTGRRKQMLEAASSGIIKAQDKETKMIEDKIQETKLEEKIKKSSQIGSGTTESSSTSDSPIALDIPLPSGMTCMSDPKSDSREEWGSIVMPDVSSMQEHDSQSASSLSTSDYNMQLPYSVPPPIMTSISMMPPTGMPEECDLTKPPPGMNMDMQGAVEGEDIYRPCDMEVEDIMDYRAITPPPPGTETPPPPGCDTPPPPGTTPPRTVTPPPPGTESFLGSQTPPPPGTSPDKATEYSSNNLNTGSPIPRNIPFENKINELKEQSIVLESIFKEAPHFEVATSIFKKPDSASSSEMKNIGEGNTGEKDDFQKEMEELMKNKLKELKGSSEESADTIQSVTSDLYEQSSSNKIDEDNFNEEKVKENVATERAEKIVVGKQTKENEDSIIEESAIEKKSPLGGRERTIGKNKNEIDDENTFLQENKIKSPVRGRRISRSTIVKSDTEEDSRDDSPSKTEEVEVKRGRVRRPPTKCDNVDELEEESFPVEISIKKSPGKKATPIRRVNKESEEEDEDPLHEIKPKTLPARSRKPSARAAAAAAASAPMNDSDEDEVEEVAKSPRKRGRKPSVRLTTDEADEDTEDAVTAVSTPSKRTSRKKTPAVSAAVSESVDEEEEDKTVKTTKRTRRQPTRTAIVESPEEDEIQEETTVSNKRSRRTRR